jgi:hypothetical protein
LQANARKKPLKAPQNLHAQVLFLQQQALEAEAAISGMRERAEQAERERELAQALPAFPGWYHQVEELRAGQAQAQEEAKHQKARGAELLESLERALEEADVLRAAKARADAETEAQKTRAAQLQASLEGALTESAVLRAAKEQADAETEAQRGRVGELQTALDSADEADAVARRDAMRDVVARSENRDAMRDVVARSENQQLMLDEDWRSALLLLLARAEAHWPVLTPQPAAENEKADAEK